MSPIPLVEVGPTKIQIKTRQQLHARPSAAFSSQNAGVSGLGSQPIGVCPVLWFSTGFLFKWACHFLIWSPFRGWFFRDTETEPLATFLFFFLGGAGGSPILLHTNSPLAKLQPRFVRLQTKSTGFSSPSQRRLARPWAPGSSCVGQAPGAEPEPPL